MNQKGLFTGKMQSKNLNIHPLVMVILLNQLPQLVAIVNRIYREFILFSFLSLC